MKPFLEIQTRLIQRDDELVPLFQGKRWVREFWVTLPGTPRRPVVEWCSWWQPGLLPRDHAWHLFYECGTKHDGPPRPEPYPYSPRPNLWQRFVDWLHK